MGLARLDWCPGTQVQECDEHSDATVARTTWKFSGLHQGPFSRAMGVKAIQWNGRKDSGGTARREVGESWYGEHGQCWRNVAGSLGHRNGMLIGRQCGIKEV